MIILFSESEVDSCSLQKAASAKVEMYSSESGYIAAKSVSPTLHNR